MLKVPEGVFSFCVVADRSYRCCRNPCPPRPHIGTVHRGAGCPTSAPTLTVAEARSRVDGRRASTPRAGCSTRCRCRPSLAVLGQEDAVRAVGPTWTRSADIVVPEALRRAAVPVGRRSHCARRRGRRITIQRAPHLLSQAQMSGNGPDTPTAGRGVRRIATADVAGAGSTSRLNGHVVSDRSPSSVTRSCRPALQNAVSESVKVPAVVA
jgi:hypothetical protein